VLLLLLHRGRKRRDLCAKGPRELDGQVSQPADTHNAHREDGLTPWMRSGL